MCSWSWAEIVLAVIVVIAAIRCFGKMILCHLGMEDVRMLADSRTPWEVDELTDNSITFSQKIDVVNEGKQCATIMDALLRPQLPYEQYDGVELKGHVELTTAPREDDYFEAYIVQAKGYKGGLDKATLKAQIKLTARHGMNIKEALAKLPDFNYLLIWLETGRRVAHYRQVRVPVLAQDIAKLAGVELVQD